MRPRNSSRPCRFTLNGINFIFVIGTLCLFYIAINLLHSKTVLSKVKTADQLSVGGNLPHSKRSSKVPPDSPNRSSKVTSDSPKRPLKVPSDSLKDVKVPNAHMEMPRLRAKVRKDRKTDLPTSNNKSLKTPEAATHQNAEEVGTIWRNLQARLTKTNRLVVNPHNFEYILNVPDMCKGGNVEAVIAVPSRIESFAQRQAIRDTWGHVYNDASNRTVLIFIFGQVANQTLQKQLEKEAKVHGDIVQESFVDSYKNLSVKSVAILRWASKFCPDSNFVLKVDDDMYINMPLLLSKLRIQLQLGPLFVLGKHQGNVKPYRWTTHKWYVPLSEYKFSEFPNYISGTAYAMSTMAAMRLFVESLYVRPITMEDVYISGILAYSASVPRIIEPKFSGHTRYDPSICVFKNKISEHGYSPEEIKTMHKKLFDPNLKCD